MVRIGKRIGEQLGYSTLQLNRSSQKEEYN